MEPHKVKIVENALKGNKDAIRLVLDLAQIARIWDNIIDADKPVSIDEKNRMIWNIMVGIQSNPFYDENRQRFVTCFKDYLNSWMDANTLEKGTDHEKHVAFILRDLIGNVIMHCAEIIDGYDWMRLVSPVVRTFQFDEPLETYMEGLKDGFV